MPASSYKIRPSSKPKPTPAPAAPALTGLKRVLLVGINYIGTPYELAGCINDVMNIQTHLKTLYPPCSDYTVLTDTTTVKPSRANILSAFDRLVAGLKPGENVYFHYSGHGGVVRDTNGDEVSGYDSCIYPCSNGSLEIITDDDLRTNLAAKVPAGCKCFIVLDACHSGTAVDLRYLWETPAAGKIGFSENTYYSKLPGTVFFLSGCKDTQTAADTADQNARPCGALTWALLDTWKTYGAAIKVKYILWDVRQFLRARGYSQIPQLTSGNYYDMNTVFDLSK